MRAGKRDRRVSVEVLTTSRNAVGEEIDSWAAWRSVWMGKRDTKANERFTGVELAAEVETVFSALWRPVEGIRPDTHRLRCEGQVFEVLGTRELGFRDGLEIFARARSEASYGRS